MWFLLAVFLCSYFSGFSSIMVPLQSSLNVTLPTGIGKSQDEHNPFPGIQPTIVKFEDKVCVVCWLQF